MSNFGIYVRARVLVARTLGKMGGRRVRDALASALWDVSATVGVEAAYALVESGHKGLSALKDALIEAEATRSDRAARCIAYGLAKAGDDSGLDHLISALFDESWSERWDALRLTAELDQPGGNDAVLAFFRRELLESERTVDSKRMNLALGALGMVRDKRAVPLLLEFLTKPAGKQTLRLGVKTLHARAVKLRERESIQALIQVIQGGNHALGQSAASSLVKIGQTALPEFEEAIAGIEQDSESWKLLDGTLSQITRGMPIERHS